MNDEDQQPSPKNGFPWKFTNFPKSLERQFLSSDRSENPRKWKTESRVIFSSLPEDRDKCDIGGITETAFPVPLECEKDPFKIALMKLLMREEMTKEDIAESLSQENWSFLEGAHLLRNKRMPKDQQAQRTLPNDIFCVCLKIYESIGDLSFPTSVITEVMRYFPREKDAFGQSHEFMLRKGERSIQGIDNDGSVKTFTDFEADKLYWRIRPDVFLEWALDNCLISSAFLLETLQLIPPVSPDHVRFEKLSLLTEPESTCLSFLHEMGFDGYKNLCKLNSLTKREKAHIRLQVAAQIIWHQAPSLTYQDFIDHPHFMKIADEEGLKTYEKNDLGDRRPTKPILSILRSVDPRPSRLKKGGRPPSGRSDYTKRTKPWPPKIIEGVILTDINKRSILHFQKLRFILKTFGQQMRGLKPKLKESELLQHPIIKLYLAQCHPLVLTMGHHWLLSGQEKSLIYPKSLPIKAYAKQKTKLSL